VPAPSPAPDSRLRGINDGKLNPGGEYVLYWMVMSRRLGHNFGLQQAVHHARTLARPLLILEALRCGNRWASARFSRFILQGMADNARALRRSRVHYYPYLEPEHGYGRGLLAALGQRACVVVTDDFPAYFLPRMLAAAGRQLAVRLEAVDSNGVLPMRAAGRAYPTAHGFRRYLQQSLPAELDRVPLARPLSGARLPPAPPPPPEVLRRWPPATDAQLDAGPEVLAALPVDHGVAPAELRGGSRAAARRWQRFLERGLARYDEDRNLLDHEGTSGLSPYLHFGHISPHQLLHDVLASCAWYRQQLSPRADGRRAGWWGLPAAAEAFLDQLITWRELGYNTCALRPDDHDRFESLPPWALQTLREHAGDPRAHRYELSVFEDAATHDELWNAAQRQLLREGRMHNYLRMLWGKKILEWTASPRQALQVMIELNNKYALDGRNPNSYSGIFWTLGRHDRAWGPERPVFGKVRYMSSDNTRRKLKVAGYLERHASQ
jgi:deoxyribodipyrimidine photo-lyase